MNQSQPTNLSRRRFLALSSAAAAGATFFDAPRILQAAHLAKKDDIYGGWPMGMQSYTLRKFDVDQAIRHIQGLGLHFVEFYGAHLSPDATEGQIAGMKAVLKKAGISISAHGVNGFSKDHEKNRKMFEFAKRAGIRNITADPSPDSFDSLDNLVAEFDIRVAIHNHGPGARYDSLESVASAVKGHHKLIGACVDTGHVLRSDEDPVKWIRELGPRVFALHVKDVEKKQKRTHDVVIGSAHLDVVEMFKAMQAVKFPADGSLSLEYESSPDNPIDDIKQCLVVARKAIAKAAG